MKKSKEIALGGLMTALSVVIMSLGTVIPFMTYVCPVFCMMIGAFLMKLISKTGYISWYAAVSVLSLLLCPDKEAAAVFVAFGLYPLVRFKLNMLPMKWVLKLLYFNFVTVLLYWVLIHLIGMQELVNEFTGVGVAVIVGMLLAGNLIFIILDITLQRLEKSNKFKKRKE